MTGLYLVFEGIDGAGKSTLMAKVDKGISTLWPSYKIHSTHHPGSTPLGAHLRKLVKRPETIDPAIKIDDLSRQMLYMVDTISFVRSMLEPALERGEIVLADRSSFISALAYGMADGLSLADISRLFQIITPPRMDRLYVLSLPAQVGYERIKSNRGPDHYDRKPLEFFTRLETIYENLITGSAEQIALVTRSVAIDDVIYLDATTPPEQLANKVIEDVVRLKHERCE